MEPGQDLLCPNSKESPRFHFEPMSHAGWDSPTWASASTDPCSLLLLGAPSQDHPDHLSSEGCLSGLSSWNAASQDFEMLPVFKNHPNCPRATVTVLHSPGPPLSSACWRNLSSLPQPPCIFFVPDTTCHPSQFFCVLTTWLRMKAHKLPDLEIPSDTSPFLMISSALVRKLKIKKLMMRLAIPYLLAIKPVPEPRVSNCDFFLASSPSSHGHCVFSNMH